MRKMKTERGIWTIYGLNLIPSDAIYLRLKEAIEQDRLDQKYLQYITGHNGPIIVDRKKKTIEFLSF